MIPVLEDKYNMSEGLDQLVQEGDAQRTTTVNGDGDGDVLVVHFWSAGQADDDDDDAALGQVCRR